MERFTARPGISLAVEYGSDHLVCQILIEPPQSLIHQEEQARLMSSEGVSEVLEEVAPASTRGKEVNSSVFVSGCNYARPNGLRARFDNAVYAYLRPFDLLVLFWADVPFKLEGGEAGAL